MNAASDDGLAGQRGRLFAVAYGMLGSVAEAEDIVQDVGEVWARTDTSEVADARAWLVTVTTRRCLDRLRSAQRRRETYVGPWLPEPIVTDGTAASSEDPAEVAALADELSLALLVVLDELSPAARVAFVLHDVFGEPFDDVAAVLGRSPAAARQLASRARRRVRGASPGRGDRDVAAGRRMAEAFVAAVGTGDLRALLSLLAPDARLTTDGGGIVTAARRPVCGADRVARFLLGIATKAGHDGRARPATINGGPGVLLHRGERLAGVVALDVRDGRVHAVQVVVNPDKLRHLDRAGPRPDEAGPEPVPSSRAAVPRHPSSVRR